MADIVYKWEDLTTVLGESPSSNAVGMLLRDRRERNGVINTLVLQVPAETHVDRARRVIQFFDRVVVEHADGTETCIKDRAGDYVSLRLSDILNKGVSDE